MHVERVGYGPALPRCALSRTRSRPSAVCQRSRCVLNHVWLRPLARAQGVAAGAICANTVATGHDHDGQIHPPERCRSGVADGVAGGHAADMIRKAPPYPVSMSPMWSGAYVGFNVGYAWGSSHATTSVADPGTYFLPASVAQIAAAGAGTVNSKGFTGGVQAGYNWQFGRVVFGIEADANALSLKGSRT